LKEVLSETEPQPEPQSPSTTTRRNLGPAKATWSIVASIVAHLGVLGGVGFIAYQSLQAREAREAQQRALNPPAAVIAIELPTMAEGSLTADRDVIPEGTTPTQYGGTTVARVDNGVAGSGGDVTGAKATNLAAMDDQMRLDTDLLSRLDRDQVQRLKTAPRRTTHDDRRATTHPMELTFLATGKGELQERRQNSPFDPNRGSMHSGAPSVLGGHPGSADDSPPDDRAPGNMAGSTRAGQLFGSPGVGLRESKPGEDHHLGARITTARPSVQEAAPTVPGVWNGRPNDTVDSDQEVANTVRSLIQASTAGAGRPGDGRGGNASPLPDPGAGGGSVGRGSIARPLGSGDGDLVDWNTTDPMLLPYFRKLHAKIDPLWANAFPKSAMLELKQGTVIIEFSIAADGTTKVTWPPVRPSGVDEFDKNCADAIRRAAPFDPLPPTLKEAGRTSLKIRAPFIAKNPIIK
jgi:TonB family protein